MATALPSSMSFEMLSRLPANSFVASWKEVRPDMPPQNGIYDMTSSHNIRFGLRGAPNEFAMNTNMYICADAFVAAEVTRTNAAAPADAIVTPAQLGAFADSPEITLGNPIDFFKSSRESFNAGALPFLDNQDPLRSHVINHLRYRCARRNIKAGVISDLRGAIDDPYNSLRGTLLTGTYANGVRLSYRTALSAPGPAQFASRSFGNKKIQIPLGTYSNLINTHSVIPIGLMSSYAVNGFTLELTTQEQNGNDGQLYSFSGTNIGGVGATIAAKCFMKDVRIFMPIIKVLDPAVMEAVLSLYEKREMVNVGGVQFPLSLRLNSLGYRTASYPLVQNQTDYFFRIAGTDRSVRAYAWKIYNKASATTGDYVNEVGIRVVRLETSIGNEKTHDVIEDVDANSSNVGNFISMNAKRSAALFSPLPYYQECRKFDGQQDDDVADYNNTISVGDIDTTRRKGDSYGVVSFENTDRRESDYSGSFQASGKDLTNVGGIEIRMRILAYLAGGVGVTNQPAKQTPDELLNYLGGAVNGVPDGNWEIQFLYAYDAVTELSPSGVMDVTNAVL